jgi:CheY-like chemotaxis protein
MENWAKLLQALSTLLWPVLVLIVIFRFTPAIAGIIESARSRKFTLKVGGQELTMDEVNKQQRTLIADLQAQVVKLTNIIESTVEVTQEHVRAEVSTFVPTRRAVLWVDDNPKNNSYFVQQLTDLRVEVDLALSTSDGLRRLEQQEYNLVISDMAREEAGAYHPSAGLDLVKAVRSTKKDVPMIIYCSARRAMEYGKQARELGVIAVTSSPTELSGIIRRELMKSEA